MPGWADVTRSCSKARAASSSWGARSQERLSRPYSHGVSEDDARAANVPEFGNEVRAAAELLRATATANTQHLDQWQAVYGRLLAGFPREVVEPIARKAQESFEQARSGADLGQSVGELIREVIDLLTGTASQLVTTTVAAHVALEKKLLEELATATGRPLADLLAELDTWVSALNSDD